VSWRIATEGRLRILLVYPTAACRCGRSDCLAALASDVAVLERARQAGLVRPRGSFASLVKASQSGSEEAAALLRQRAEYVGIAAGILLDLLDPDLLILGGGLLQTPEHLDALRAGAVPALDRRRDGAAEEAPAARFRVPQVSCARM
jgi:predicted NBD/HSP70 family sugar kinase